MATMNPFDLLVDDDAEDPNQLVAASKVEKTKKAPAPAAQTPAKLPSKPVAPSQAVREARNEGGRGGGGRGRGRGYGQGRGGGRGYDQDFSRNENSFGNGFSRGGYRPSEEGDGGKPSERNFVPRGGYRGGRRGGYDNGEATEGERPRRVYERRSGTGHGSEFKRDGAGRGNWGAPVDEIAPEGAEAVTEVEKNVSLEKPVAEEGAPDAKNENPVDEAKAKEEEAKRKEQEEEEKQMTLEEYEKVLAEKRKALLADKAEERKVDAKVFESMQQISNKKNNNDVFIKLGSEKDKRKDAAADKEEKAKKVLSINEFLKPAEGQRYSNPRGGGRDGRGGGRGGSGGGGGYGYGNATNLTYGAKAPAIADLGQFPSLGGN